MEATTSRCLAKQVLLIVDKLEWVTQKFTYKFMETNVKRTYFQFNIQIFIQ